MTRIMIYVISLVGDIICSSTILRQKSGAIMFGSTNEVEPEVCVCQKLT